MDKQRSGMARSAVAALVLALTSPAAVGAASAPATMSGTWDPVTTDGTFSVDSGPLQAACSGGMTHDYEPVVAGAWPSGRVQFIVVKTFECVEGPTFVLSLKVKLDFAPAFSDSFTWSVVSGTDGLAGLRGAGTGYGDDLGDHYAGRLTLG